MRFVSSVIVFLNFSLLKKLKKKPVNRKIQYVRVDFFLPQLVVSLIKLYLVEIEAVDRHNKAGLRSFYLMFCASLYMQSVKVFQLNILVKNCKNQFRNLN